MYHFKFTDLLPTDGVERGQTEGLQLVIVVLFLLFGLEKFFGRGHGFCHLGNGHAVVVRSLYNVSNTKKSSILDFNRNGVRICYLRVSTTGM